MKTQGFQITGLTLAATVLMAFSSVNVFAQNTSAVSDTASPAPVVTPAPPLSPADQEVLQLVQAKISDGTIITYVQNSGTVYGLNAAQIIYLKQQGVSEAVINAMLNQRGAMASTAPTPAPANNAPGTAQTTASTTATVVQPTTPAPATTYIVPDTQTYDYNDWATPYWYYPYYSPYYYGYYGWPAGVYWGWHGGYYGGGWHGGGGFHGGGGWHGGGGGWHR